MSRSFFGDNYTSIIDRFSTYLRKVFGIKWSQNHKIIRLHVIVLYVAVKMASVLINPKKASGSNWRLYVFFHLYIFICAVIINMFTNFSWIICYMFFQKKNRQKIVSGESLSNRFWAESWNVHYKNCEIVNRLKQVHIDKSNIFLQNLYLLCIFAHWNVQK